MTQAVARDMSGARAEAAVDWFLHPVLTGLGDAELAEVAAMASRAGYSVYDGRAVTGWPRFVIRRGHPVLADGQCTAQPGQGQWVHRDPASGPNVRP
jgi:hypothetical protein